MYWLKHHIPQCIQEKRKWIRPTRKSGIKKERGRCRLLALLTLRVLLLLLVTRIWRA
jgi:hypothetical protein